METTGHLMHLGRTGQSTSHSPESMPNLKSQHEPLLIQSSSNNNNTNDADHHHHHHHHHQLNHQQSIQSNNIRNKESTSSGSSMQVSSILVNGRANAKLNQFTKRFARNKSINVNTSLKETKQQQQQHQHQMIATLKKSCSESEDGSIESKLYHSSASSQENGSASNVRERNSASALTPIIGIQSSSNTPSIYGQVNLTVNPMISNGPDRRRSSFGRKLGRRFTQVFSGITNKRNSNTSAAHGNNQKALKTLGVIMGCFILCWLPFFILALIKPITLSSGAKVGDHIPKWFDSLLLWLGYFNSALNPVIYARFTREFREPFIEILCCRCKGINETLRERQRKREMFGQIQNKQNFICCCKTKESLADYGHHNMNMTGGQSRNSVSQYSARFMDIIDRNDKHLLNPNMIVHTPSQEKIQEEKCPDDFKEVGVVPTSTDATNATANVNGGFNQDSLSSDSKNNHKIIEIKKSILNLSGEDDGTDAALDYDHYKQKIDNEKNKFFGIDQQQQQRSNDTADQELTSAAATAASGLRLVNEISNNIDSSSLNKIEKDLLKPLDLKLNSLSSDVIRRVPSSASASSSTSSSQNVSKTYLKRQSKQIDQSLDMEQASSLLNSPNKNNDPSSDKDDENSRTLRLAESSTYGSSIGQHRHSNDGTIKADQSFESNDTNLVSIENLPSPPHLHTPSTNAQLISPLNDIVQLPPSSSSSSNLVDQDQKSQSNSSSNSQSNIQTAGAATKRTKEFKSKQLYDINKNNRDFYYEPANTTSVHLNNSSTKSSIATNDSSSLAYESSVSIYQEHADPSILSTAAISAQRYQPTDDSSSLSLYSKESSYINFDTNNNNFNNKNNNNYSNNGNANGDGNSGSRFMKNMKNNNNNNNNNSSINSIPGSSVYSFKTAPTSPDALIINDLIEESQITTSSSLESPINENVNLENELQMNATTSKQQEKQQQRKLLNNTTKHHSIDQAAIIKQPTESSTKSIPPDVLMTMSSSSTIRTPLTATAPISTISNPKHQQTSAASTSTPATSPQSHVPLAYCTHNKKSKSSSPQKSNIATIVSPSSAYYLSSINKSNPPMTLAFNNNNNNNNKNDSYLATVKSPTSLNNNNNFQSTTSNLLNNNKNTQSIDESNNNNVENLCTVISSRSSNLNDNNNNNATTTFGENSSNNKDSSRIIITTNAATTVAAAAAAAVATGNSNSISETSV